MHTYREQEAGVWQVVYDLPGETRVPVGPRFNLESEAAAFASFLNGGRYNPYEIEAVFLVPAEEDDDGTVHPARPKSLEDYPVEGMQLHRPVRK